VNPVEFRSRPGSARPKGIPGPSWGWVIFAASDPDREFADSPPEGSGFELLVPRCALIANSAAVVAPPDSAVSGGSLSSRA
jgi:hypothetical protein